jgi:hypothetical protein
MISASLEVASQPWRGARAAATLLAFLRRDLPADDVLAGLEPLGPAPHGWWSILERVRHAGAVSLLLPRPGDPRGLALPRGMTAQAALGWPKDGGTSWLIPTGIDTWTAVEVPKHAIALPDPAACDRRVREEVVRAAHAVDAMDLDPGSVPGRGAREAIVDSWLLGPPALPQRRRSLAALSLRILLALDALGSGSAHARVVDTASLESAARAALEAAYSTLAAQY